MQELYAKYLSKWCKNVSTAKMKASAASSSWCQM